MSTGELMPCFRDGQMGFRLTDEGKSAAADSICSVLRLWWKCWKQTLQRGNQFGSSIRFLNVAVAEQPRSGSRFFSSNHAEEEYFGSGGDSPDFQRGLHAVHHRHVDIQEDDIGIQLFDFFDRFPAVFRFSADLYFMPSEQLPNRGPSNCVVIDDKDS